MSLATESADVRSSIPLPPAVLDRLRTRANNLKMLPAVATQALEIVKDLDCGINEFAAVVERDPSLAAGILRMANSILFSAGKPVLNLHQAVIRLGIRQCKNLIVTASFSSMMKSMTLEEEWVRESLALHSFTTAILCLHLNRSLKIGFQGEEFVGGLVHDIGRMLLATAYSEHFNEIDPLNFDDESDVLALEESKLETNHAEVGAWFAVKNELPEQLVAIIRHHHGPDLSSPSDRRLVSLVAAADHMANHLQRFEEAEGYDPLQNTAIGLLDPQRSAQFTAKFLQTAVTMMDEARREAAGMLEI